MFDRLFKARTLLEPEIEADLGKTLAYLKKRPELLAPIRAA